MVKEKPAYKFRGRDFLLGGSGRYTSRNTANNDGLLYDGTQKDNRSTPRMMFLTIYHVAIPTLLVLGAAFGLERLLR